MVRAYQTQCDIAVPEQSVDVVGRLLSDAGFEVVVGDRQAEPASRPRRLRTVKKHGAASGTAGMSRLLAHEVLVRRTLHAAGLNFEVLHSDAGSVEPQAWWPVRFAATQKSTGLRIRASGPDGMEIQLAALAQFLGIPRESLTAGPDSGAGSSAQPRGRQD